MLTYLIQNPKAISNLAPLKTAATTDWEVKVSAFIIYQSQAINLTLVQNCVIALLLANAPT